MNKWSEEQLNVIREHFTDTKNEEILREISSLGSQMSMSSMIRFARRFRLFKSKEFIDKVNAESMEKMIAHNINTGYFQCSEGARKNSKKNGAKNIGWFASGVSRKVIFGEEKERLRIEKSAESRRKTVEKEKRLISLGLEQKTRLNLTVHYNRTEVNLRCEARKIGYIVYRGEGTIYYDKNVQRDLRFEERLKKYDILLIPLCMRGKKLKEGSMVLQAAGAMMY